MYKSILVIGSYNGQDSLGDKYLLRCVATQLRQLFGKDTCIISHIDGDIEVSQAEMPEINFYPGLSRLYWRWYAKLRHLHLPTVLHRFFAFITVPLFSVATANNRQVTRRILREIKQSPLVYFYGGTQLSGQWFWYNFIPLLLMALLCKFYHVPLFWGPQQYGPQSYWQRQFLRWTVRFLVKDIRTRNIQCLDLLKLSKDALLYDEVYSCTARYPVVAQHQRQPTFILVNMRGTNFLNDTNSEQEFESFLQLLLALKKELNLPFKLFQMSGASFCDDTKLIDYLKAKKFTELQLEILPPLANEYELITLAQQAYGTVSMSFHGCILSIHGGCPAVPLTLGKYYDYKYVDFDKYAGEQKVPLIFLDHLEAQTAAESICAYFRSYHPEQTALARKRAEIQINQWYQKVVGFAQQSTPSVGHLYDKPI